jgi:hypothetical protein
VARARRKLNVDDTKTVAPSQNFEPIVRMLRNRETKVKCMVRYPMTMMTMSMVGAFY